MTPSHRHRSTLPTLALALAALLGPWPALARAGADRAAPPAVSPAALAERYGIRITRVGVTGGGGMVDLRFTVLDPAKAAPLLQGGHAPRLIAGRNGPALEAPHHGAQRNIRLAKDAACFVLYPNARNAVRPGAAVSVAFGEVRAGPVVAK